MDPLIDSVHAAMAAGIDHIYFHLIGDPTDGFIDAWRSELGPALTGRRPAPGATR